MPPAVQVNEPPPHSIEAEMQTLGSMLIEVRAIETVAGILREDGQDFHRDNHKAIFSTIFEMHRQGLPVDVMTLKEELKSRDGLEHVGGPPYLMALVDAVSTAANVAYHAKVVLDKSQKRAALAVVLGLVEDAFHDDAVTIWQKAETRLGRVAERTPGKSAAPKRKTIAERTIDLADVEPPLDLPLMFGRYLLLGTAHWLTGATGLGKSTLAYNIACALAEGTPLWGIECEPQRVLYVDMESGDVGRALKVERLYRDAPRVRDRLIFLREPVKLPDELPALLAYVQQREISIVIFDTARRVFSVKDENDNAEFYNRIAPTLDSLKQIGVASLTMGHPSKNGNGSARGAGAQEDAGDVNLSLVLYDGEINAPNSVIALRVTKNRLLGHVPPLYLRRVGEDQFERINAEEAPPVETAAEKGKSAQCQDAITEFLKAQADGYATHKDIMQAMKTGGFTRSTAMRAFEECKERGFITPALHARYPKGGWVQSDPFADEEAG